ncbi:hypothetical protein BDV93DRAFT_515912 [Ceratobasidium sp. AG-I]|nr:hypothetical protein BDV93DRAFT_515912 [Ceratobasidium sp. AG-I]
MSEQEEIALKSPASEAFDELHDEDLPLIQRMYPILQPPDENTLLVVEHISNLFITNYTGLGVNGSGVGYQPLIAGIMKVFLDALAKSTGAHFFATGCWDDSMNNTICTSYSTPEVAGFASSKDGAAARDLFMINAEQTLGPRFTTDIMKAHPVVYGMEADGFRPRLPPVHTNPEDEKSNIITYMLKTAEWQGALAPINWHQVGLDQRSQKPVFIERWRLPTTCPAFGRQGTWTAVEISALGKYIRDHQTRLDKGDTSAEATAFQWRTVYGVDGSIVASYDSYCREIHPKSTLTYPPEAAFYMSSLTLHQIQHSDRPSCFSEHDKRVIEDLHVLGERRMDMFHSVDSFFRTRSPEVDITTLSTCPAVILHLHSMSATPESLSQSYLLPEAFYYITNPDFDSWSVQSFLKWSYAKGLIVQGTGLTANGPQGALLAYLALIVLALNVQKTNYPDAPPRAIAFEPGRNEIQMLQIAASNLQIAVEGGLRSYRQTESSTGPQTSRRAAWEPNATYLLTPDGTSEKYEPGNWKSVGAAPMEFQRPAAQRPGHFAWGNNTPSTQSQNIQPAPTTETAPAAGPHSLKPLFGESASGAPLSAASTSIVGEALRDEIEPRRFTGQGDSRISLEKVTQVRSGPIARLPPHDLRQTRSERPLHSELPPLDRQTTRRSLSADRHTLSHTMELDVVDSTVPDPGDSPAGLGLTLMQDESHSNKEPDAQSTPAMRGRPTTRRFPQPTPAQAGAPEQRPGTDPSGSRSTNTGEAFFKGAFGTSAPGGLLVERSSPLPVGARGPSAPPPGVSTITQKRGTLLGLVNAHINATGPSSPSTSMAGSTSANGKCITFTERIIQENGESFLMAHDILNSVSFTSNGRAAGTFYSGLTNYKPGKNEIQMLQVAAHNLQIAIEGGLRSYRQKESSTSSLNSRRVAWEPSATYLLTPDGTSEKYEPGNWKSAGTVPMEFKRPADLRPGRISWGVGQPMAQADVRPVHSSWAQAQPISQQVAIQPVLPLGTASAAEPQALEQRPEGSSVVAPPLAETSTIFGSVLRDAQEPRRSTGQDDPRPSSEKIAPVRFSPFERLHPYDVRQTRSERPILSELPAVEREQPRRSLSADRHTLGHTMDLDVVDTTVPDPSDSSAGLGLTLLQDDSHSNREPDAQSTPATRGCPTTRRNPQPIPGQPAAPEQRIAQDQFASKSKPETSHSTGEAIFKGTFGPSAAGGPLVERSFSLPVGAGGPVAPSAGFPSSGTQKRGTLLGMVNAHINAAGPSSPSSSRAGSTSVNVSTRITERASTRRSSSRAPSSKRSRTAFSPETGPVSKKRSASRGDDKQGEK